MRERERERGVQHFNGGRSSGIPPRKSEAATAPPRGFNKGRQESAGEVGVRSPPVQSLSQGLDEEAAQRREAARARSPDTERRLRSRRRHRFRRHAGRRGQIEELLPQSLPESRGFHGAS